MKYLFLVRHAKSSWEDPDLTDRERPLNSRGKEDAPRIGKALKRRLNTLALLGGITLEEGQPTKQSPDYEEQLLILTSPAKRARKTAKLIAAEIGAKDIRINEDIYGASSLELVDIIRSMNDSVDRLMIVGHNPTMTIFVNELIDRGLANMPTCGVACISSETDTWRNFSSPNLEFYLFPKDLR